MFLLLSISFFLFPLNIKSLICPVYNLFNNETDTCDRSCSYLQTQSIYRRCLGIYKFDKHFKTKDNLIHIRQLALVDDYEEKYSNNTECILDIDKTGSNLLCRCNSDNCTLKWRTDENLTEKFYQKINLESNNWLIPSIVALFIIVNIIILIIIINYCWYRKRKEKDTKSFLENLSSISTNISNAEIDEFLSSNPTYQSIISHGKTSIIYRAWTTGKGNLQHEKKLIAVKLYHGQEHKNLFENEVQILRMINHSTIVK
jgi:hypothetical protein